MADGYIKTKADSSWWMAQVQAGIEFRKKYAQEMKWQRWRQYYRGQWKSDVLPVNKFFSILRTLVPRVYFRNPAVSVTPAMGGFLNMAFAQLTHRIDNKMILQMGVKKTAKRIVQNTWLFGTGFGKLGYGGQFSLGIQTGMDDAPMGPGGERLEYQWDTAAGMPWFRSAHPGSVIVPNGLCELQDARWVAQWLKRPKDDVRRDPRLKGAGDLPSTSKMGVQVNVLGSAKDEVDMVDLIEIRDRKFQQAIVIAPYGSGAKVLFQGPDSMCERRLPFFEVVFNPDDEVFWGVPDPQVIEPYQLELNEIRTQAMKHRRLALVKLLYEEGVIEESEITKLLSEDVGAGVKIKGTLNQVHFQQNTQIPMDYIPHEGQVEHSIREAVGFSRNQLGEFQTRRGDTSATEAAQVGEAAEIRVDERRDIVADMITDMVVEMNEILFDNWTVEQVVDVVGPGGVPVWVRVDPQMLKAGRYHVKVDPDSATTRTRQQREAKALGLYNVLKMNPFIDPIKLTQYLLNEMEGVEMDDLMRAMPPVQNGAAGGVLHPGQFAGMLQNGMSQLMSNPGLLLPGGGG